MRTWLRKHGETIVVAAVIGALAVGGPALAGFVKKAVFAKRAAVAKVAKNARKVDGLSAVKASADPDARAGKLLATGGDGLLPGDALYQRTILVGPVGSPAANGEALRSAVDGISGATGDNHFLVQIEPGTYDLGSTPLEMKSFVDIEGAGELATTIRAADTAPGSATVLGAGGAELRFLTVTNDSPGGVGTSSVAIRNTANDFRATHVTATASDAANNTAIQISDAAFVRLTDVEAAGNGDGIGSQTARGVTAGGSSAGLSLRDVTATASGGTSDNVGLLVAGGSSATVAGGVLASSGIAGDQHGIAVSSMPAASVTVRNARIRGATNTVLLFDAAHTVRIGASQLDGGAVEPGPGTVTCAQSYDESFGTLTNC